MENSVSTEPESGEISLFISETLRAIMKGISDAQPTAVAYSSLKDRKFAFSFEPPREVSFDIAVSAKKSGITGAGLKLEVFSAGINAKADKQAEMATVNRVLFTVPTAVEITK